MQKTINVLKFTQKVKKKKKKIQKKTKTNIKIIKIVRASTKVTFRVQYNT